MDVTHEAESSSAPTRVVSYDRAVMESILKFLPHLLLLAMGCGMVLRAGRLESGGELVQAKRVARQGGWLAGFGSLVAAVGAAALPASAPARGGVAGMMLGAGFAALLAGLSGKPRPTGWAALALLLAGAVVGIASVR
jgi:hypothetical protein